MEHITKFPRQQLPFSQKTKSWRKQVVDWANSKTFFNYSLVRKSVIHKKINYDLLNGKLHMSDVASIINPEGTQAEYIPDTIQHLPIMNSKLNVLRGEESKRIFDYRVVITNPNSISQIEENKKKELLQRLQEMVSDSSQSEEEFEEKLEKLNDYYSYEWQDLMEIRANELLNHYTKEYNMPLIFEEGFMDAMTVGEELYQCDIVGGEPVITRLNPLKVRVFKSGYSKKVEDADMIILEDYWSPGKVIDTFYDVLTDADIKYLEEIPDNIGQATSDSMNQPDERLGFIHNSMIDDTMSNSGDFYFDPLNLFSDNAVSSLLPFDLAGNVRVLRVYWKSRRRIKKVKSYNVETGEEEFNFYPENYIIDKDKGEEEKIFYVNEAWEGTKIADKIYLNMRPRVVQYNRLSNPSRCHFGIIGSIYNLNDSKPFSLVDMMKPYNYLYDIYHDRLNKSIAHNWGKIIKLDLAMVPKGWEIEKWMYYAKTNGVMVIDSFKEGNEGAARGKLAGGLNNASSGVIDAETGNYIQQHINLLEFVKMEMAEVAGISKQREGQVSNRETVGGVERATLQSSHITEWLFNQHSDLKKRVMECFLETAKVALKGRSKKFQYILSDGSLKVMDIEGDEFADSDYGLVVSNDEGAQKLNQQLETLAQAALQTQRLSFSTIMKLYGSSSLAQKQRLVEKDETAINERSAQAQQQQLESQQAIAEQAQQVELQKIEFENQKNIRDNETKLLVAQIGKDDGIQSIEASDDAKEALLEKIREFDSTLDFNKQKHKDEIAVKKQAINKKPNNTK